MGQRNGENNSQWQGVLDTVEATISKGRQRAEASTHSNRDFKPELFASVEGNCLVETYRVYSRSKPMHHKNAPFYV